ncbi:hypothetical protein Pyn_38789 [Prunus yedoensis var. nudiflora]|uniref:Uncharacterized protein n=1 Tax=Prunus yedoensis var. nudiflora TaxID=2094558 RepID=A0A314YZC0_PRUYE|nr:hypothetical protein Pyn_38789 [Prunus yedoensis var. nudiflora]
MLVAILDDRIKLDGAPSNKYLLCLEVLSPSPLRASPLVASSPGRTGGKPRRALPAGQACPSKLRVPSDWASPQAKPTRFGSMRMSGLAGPMRMRGGVVQ